MRVILSPDEILELQSTRKKLKHVAKKNLSFQT